MKYMCNVCGKVHVNFISAAVCHPDVVELDEISAIVESIIAPTAYLRSNGCAAQPYMQATDAPQGAEKSDEHSGVSA